MATRLSKLFGMDIYSVEGEYKGKVFDLIVNLEKGKIETITTEPLKPKTKQEARRILTEKSIQYRRVKSAKDILVVGGASVADEEAPQAQPRYIPHSTHKRIGTHGLRFRH